MTIAFILNSILLGAGLAMDAFSVSCANGLNEPKMKAGRMNYIAGCYGFFQFAMPMIGWICVHTVVEKFRSFEKFIPWIALVLLAYIGGKMLLEGIRAQREKKRKAPAEPSLSSDEAVPVSFGEENGNTEQQNRTKDRTKLSPAQDTPETALSSGKTEKKLTFGTLLVQGIATSIDALSVGFTIAEYNLTMALVSSLIIAAVTHLICIGGLIIGKKVGTKLESRASVAGGLILIAIGLEIWLKGIF